MMLLLLFKSVKCKHAKKVGQNRDLPASAHYPALEDAGAMLTAELFEIAKGAVVNIRCIKPLVR